MYIVLRVSLWALLGVGVVLFQPGCMADATFDYTQTLYVITKLAAHWNGKHLRSPGRKPGEIREMKDTQKKLIFTDEVIHAASPQLSTLFSFFKENGCKVQEFVEMLGSTLEVTVIRCYRNKTEVK